MFVGFFPMDKNIMTHTNNWIEARNLLRETTLLGHKILADKFPSIADEINKTSREFISAFDAETDAGIRFSYLIDKHIYNQTQTKEN